jgi:beta-glucosidase
VRYLASHLAEAEQVLAADVDVRGYLYWSSFDNVEWTRGYAPTFGLVGVPPGRRFGTAATPGSSGHE